MNLITKEKLAYCLMMKGYSDRKRYTFYSTLLSLIIGFYWYTIPIAAEHMHFFYSIPIATCLCANLGWKLVMKSKESYSFGNSIKLSLILTLSVTYLNWLILAVERRITGGPIDYNGVQESLIMSLVYIPLFNTCLSIFIVGYVGVLLFVVSGMFVIKTTQLD